MKKVFLVLLAVMLIAAPALAIQLEVDSDNKGQFSTLKVVGANLSVKEGSKAVINFHRIDQGDTTAAIPALTLDQDDTDQPLLAIECETGATSTNTCSHYQTTVSSKAGTIKITVNGATRYIPFYESLQ